MQLVDPYQINQEFSQWNDSTLEAEYQQVSIELSTLPIAEAQVIDDEWYIIEDSIIELEVTGVDNQIPASE